MAKGQGDAGIKEDIMLSEILITERQILYDNHLYAKPKK